MNYKPLWNNEFKGKITDRLKSGQTYQQIRKELGFSHIQLLKNRAADNQFATDCNNAIASAKNEHVRLRAKIESLTAELETAKKQLAEYAELLRWRLTEKEPPIKKGYYMAHFPNLHGSYRIEVWMENEFIDCEPDEQPPYWRPIIDNEPDHEDLP